MKKLSLFFTVLYFAVFLTQTAAAIDVKTNLIGNFSSFSNDPPSINSVSPKFAFGFGVGIGIPMGTMLSLDLGMNYIQRISKLTNAVASVEMSYFGLYVPVTARYTFLKLISVGAGGYLFQGLGSGVTNTDESTGAKNKPSYDGANLERTDFGLTFVAGFNYPLMPTMNLFLDGAYNLGLQDIDKSAASKAAISEVQILLGAKFGI